MKRGRQISLSERSHLNSLSEKMMKARRATAERRASVRQVWPKQYLSPLNQRGIWLQSDFNITESKSPEMERVIRRMALFSSRLTQKEQGSIKAREDQRQAYSHCNMVVEGKRRAPRAASKATYRTKSKRDQERSDLLRYFIVFIGIIKHDTRARISAASERVVLNHAQMEKRYREKMPIISGNLSTPFLVFILGLVTTAPRLIQEGRRKTEKEGL